MTIDQAGDKVKQAVDGTIGKGAIALLLTIVLGLTGFTLRTTVDHSSDLAEVRADVRDLIELVKRHNDDVDKRIEKIVDSAQTTRDSVIELQASDRLRLREQEEMLAPRRIPGP